FDFVLDDQIVIVDNDYTKKGFAGIRDIFSHDSFSRYFGGQRDLVEGSRYRPLSIAFFAVIHEVAGMNSAIYHGANILLYALLCLLIFRVLGVLFHEQMNPARWFASVPFLGALIYTIH